MRVENFGTLKYYQLDDILNYYSKLKKRLYIIRTT